MKILNNRLVITVSDVNSTKSYNIHQLFKKIIFIAIIVAFVVIAGSFWFISFLSNEISDFKGKKEKEIALLTEKEKKLQAQNLFYSMKIKGKVKDIEELSSKLDSIEEIVGLNRDTNEQIAITKATLTKITPAQKMYMLSTIPNGAPLQRISVSANFGYRIHPVTHEKKFHRGIDLRAHLKTSVFATADGVVRYVQPKNTGDYGRVIILSHNFGFETVYAHLSATKVKLGDVIKKNQVIGMTGNSGRSTGPHLHYEVRYASMVLNPRDFIDWNLKKYESIFSKQRRVQWEYLVNLIKEQQKLEQL
ncbi:M23 family metallopeptidase [Arcobacter sp. KX21116]|jgi:murein DD-endopeptidase MepM/ murein hydrolase activator NlpD|uniref:M23 family metallopeptidase n=1 Tax=Arcobacter iocasae TaxID=2906515 RepID=UPI0035D4BF73|tara:strand:+ start:1436 stop:2350 length:915 start_codon:yes stop_codon:yes gene_type:complete